MFRFERFNPDKEKEWDQFIENMSVNGTFLQSRRFLNYHEDGKFTDSSLMIYNSKNNLAAVCPACEVFLNDRKVFYSHRGTTFGGLILDKKHYCAKYVMELVGELKDYLREQGYEEAVLKLTSDVFSTVESDLLQYTFSYHGFIEYKELSTYVDFSKYKEDIISNLAQGKRTNVHNCIKESLEVKALKEDSAVEEFYEILCENLSKYDTKPVHTLEELLEFKNSRLEKECEFFGVYKEDEMIAGSMMFYFEKASCAHTQYLAAKQSYNKLSPMTFMYYSMLVEMKARGYKNVSWGTATEELGKVLNIGLITSKEDFGSSYCNNLTYCYDFANME